MSEGESFFPSTLGRRSRSRLRLRVPGHVLTTAGRQNAVLADISLEGAHLVVTQTPKVGNDCFLSWDGHEHFATIVWARGQECGVAFEEPLSKQDLDRARSLADTSFSEILEQGSRASARAWVAGTAKLGGD